MSATYELRPGCSRIAHECLGFCGHCPEFTMAAEGTSWRILALTGTPADPVLLLSVMHNGERFVEAPHA